MNHILSMIIIHVKSITINNRGGRVQIYYVVQQTVCISGDKCGTWGDGHWTSVDKDSAQVPLD